MPTVEVFADGDHHRLRRDAERNVEKISAAAMTVFAERGLEVSVADVAERSGVGVGTVYRRFGDKNGLIRALFEAEIESVVELAEAAVRADDAGRAFVEFCLQASTSFANNKGLRDLMLAGGVEPTEFTLAAQQRLSTCVQILVDNAKRAGWLRDSFSHNDFPVMLAAIGAAREFGGPEHPDLWLRTLALMFDGMRNDSRTPLTLDTPPPLTEEQAQAIVESPHR
ncbi:TetR/AcrR family transcriptional regulator [Nocardia miyunensis]|uniref:TetR/AcrR family transcriptional regulator n=1 Tax=Nocardia miyunensis TaxID=282684 RepID=UPI00082A2C3A|nr:TetR/AcrR family transcriptional regulator [Nocardia miyunensis]